MNIKSFFLGACFFFPILAHAVNDLQKQDAFLQELEAAKYTLGLKYCPTDWKAEYLNWSADTAFEYAKSQLVETDKLSTRDYQKVFRGFLGSLQDYHVSTIFYSTEWSAFPLSVKSVNERYFITGFDFRLSMNFLDFGFEFSDIDIDRVDSELAKCHVGDELIKINGIPTKDVIEDLIDRELDGDRTPTGYALAERMLFTRYGKRGHLVPKGDFTITVKNHKNGKKKTLLLTWLHVDEWVNDPKTEKTLFDLSNPRHRLEKCTAKDYSVSLAKELLKSPLSQIMSSSHNNNDDDNDWREKSFVPPLGKILWETHIGSDFYAYIYQNEQMQKIGYMHIPDFDAGWWNADDYMNQWIAIIEKFEAETKALVVDLNDNPGGDLFYMYGILSLLTDRPLKTPLNIETLVQEDIYNMAVLYNMITYEPEDTETDDQISLFDSISGYPLDKEALKKIADYFLSVIDQWNAGATRTKPQHVFGIDLVMPHPKANYTKPILLLINELDFSCGDLFPAILQDNERAVLFGKKTAGAGGDVRPYFQTSRFGIMQYSLTASLAYRLNGDVIENLGVKPDVAYKFSQLDLQFGFSDYIKAVNRHVYQLIK